MRLLSFGHNRSGCWWVRIRTPLSELAKKHTVVMANGMDRIPLDGWQIVIFNNIIGGIDLMEGEEVVKQTSIKEMVEHFKSKGAKIVYDTDDAIDIHPNTEGFAKDIDKDIDSYFYLLKNADLVTVTTEQLKKHVSKLTKRPIAVLPNCIDPGLFPKRKQESKVKIGFAGSPSHIPDLDLAMPAIENLKEKYDIYFETLGFQKGNCKWKKPVAIEKYYQALADLGADIGICPLLDNDFNKNKSPLKFLEYAMAGSMVLASNRYPYKGEMNPEWLVDDNKWEETLERFILDKDLRERTLREQREWIFEHRDIKEQSKLWLQEYRKLL
jgi:glycosyltransferase involved in cell wall biosynthesis